MSKTCLFWQPAGIGDIFFLQKAAKHFISLGYDVVWPVIPQFSYIKNYIEGIQFVSPTDDFVGSKYYETTEPVITDEFLYFPLNVSHHHVSGTPMKTKYPLFSKFGFDITSDNWKDHLQFKRNDYREQRCKRILGIEDGEEFVFVNDIFASPPDLYRREMNIPQTVKTVYHKPEHVGEFNLFDMCWVLENAKEIHTVETSLCYLVEKLETKGELFMYSRKIYGRNQHPSFDYVSHIYNKKWNYIL
jgi:hypothetical protein